MQVTGAGIIHSPRRRGKGPKRTRRRVASHRSLLQVSLWGLAGSLILGGLASWTQGTRYELWDWTGAHRAMALYAFLMPALTFLHLHALDRTLQIRASPIKVNFRAWAWGFGGVMMAMAALLPDAQIRSLARLAAAILLLGAAGTTTGLLLSLLPKKKQSVVNVEKDPLTKGDDASLAHMRFAHYFLVLGLLLSLLGHGAFIWQPATTWATAGDHLLLIGYGLLSLFGLSHLWVPRLSGVPAIAAGAIKGELHSSRLGIVLLIPGFVLNQTWMLVVGGMSIFVAAFTFMGTLGANIMKNKSRTQRVTPEFNYVPWVFAGSFWIISGVLLGMFVRVAGTAIPDAVAQLRFIHAHSLLAGGFVLLFLGFLLKLLATWAGTRQPTFHETKWSFYALNLGLAMLVVGRLSTGVGGAWFQWGAALSLVGLAAWFLPLRASYRITDVRR